MNRNPRRPTKRVNSDKPSSSDRPNQANPVSQSLFAETCQICMQTFNEPFSTVCGHTFCRTCILWHTDKYHNCPQCQADLDPENLIPNYTAAALIDNARRTRESMVAFKRLASELKQDHNLHCNSFDEIISSLDSSESIDKAIVTLKRRRLELSLSCEKKKVVMLNEFFDQMIAKRNESLAQMLHEIQILKEDKLRINEMVKCETTSPSFSRVVPDSNEENLLRPPEELVSSLENEQISSFKKRIQDNLTSIEECYFDIRHDSVDGQEMGVGSLSASLDKFSNILTGVSKYAKIRRLATLNYSVESFPNSSIVSSIEFDYDSEFFVIAGVSNKIKVHNFNAVAYGESTTHYPITQLQCSSKISNVSYNPYVKNLLSSSDYDGHVRLWDVATNANIRTYSEHEKRCWTVQFNNTDPHLMASGSDDAKVKIWNINVMQSVCTVDAKVNVCCVHFNPISKYQFIFGSADHCVHLYDLRNISRPVNTFFGHQRAVSYVKFCNENEFVSASVDSTLRLWDVKSGFCRQVMRGHQNEKNFVGLSTDGHHVVCGSENNHLFTYYKNITNPMLSYDFSARRIDPQISELTLMPAEQSSADFVSAVCWRKNSNIVVAASSQGCTHVLEFL